MHVTKHIDLNGTVVLNALEALRSYLQDDVLEVYTRPWQCIIRLLERSITLTCRLLAGS
jgi:hypothetical protein